MHIYLRSSVHFLAPRVRVYLIEKMALINGYVDDRKPERVLHKHKQREPRDKAVAHRTSSIECVKWRKL